MKKNYIAPEMDKFEVDVQPICLSEFDEEADSSTTLSKRFNSIFDDEQDPTFDE